MDDKGSSSRVGLRGIFADTGIVPPSYGQNETSPLVPVSTFRTSFASVSVHMRDRIRLLRFPESDIQRIQEIIRSSWPRGIQDLRPYDQSKEIKLHGNPWASNHDSQKLEARRLVMGLLQGLFDMGWVLKMAVDVSKKEFDKGMCSPHICAILQPLQL